ncbi:hypothetical protein GCM10027591_04690 [Zhihengliuella somnathii]
MTGTYWKRLAAVLALVRAAALGVSACSASAGPEEGVDVEDVTGGDEQSEGSSSGEGYDGTYDRDLFDDMDSFVGEEITVSASVGEVVGSHGFTITGEDSGVEPLLIVHGEDLPDVDPGTTVRVTGTVHEDFGAADAEAETGVALAPVDYDNFAGQRYLHATMIDTDLPDEELEDTGNG